MRLSRKLAALAAFFVVGAAVAGCGSAVSGGTVASVAGNAITLQAFDHWMYVAAKDQVAQAASQGLKEPVVVSNNPTNLTSCVAQIRAGIPNLRTATTATLETDCKSVFTQDTTQVMQFLIEGYWFQAEAHKLGVKAPNIAKYFDKYVAKQWPTKVALTGYLTSSGQTRQDLLYQYTVETLYVKLLKRYEKPVTKAAVDAYYATHKATFGTPETVDLHQVLTKTPAQAQAAYNALKSGKSWATVAAKYSSTASGKTNGGLLTGITATQEEAAVSKVIFASPVGKVVGPIKGIFGYYVIDVTAITPAVQPTLAQESAAIKTTLATQEQTAAATTVTALVKKDWQAKTTCGSRYQVTECSNYTAPKTTTAVTPTTPATTSTPTPTTTSSPSKSKTGTSKSKTGKSKTGTTKSKG